MALDVAPTISLKGNMLVGGQTVQPQQKSANNPFTPELLCIVMVTVQEMFLHMGQVISDEYFSMYDMVIQVLSYIIISV